MQVLTRLQVAVAQRLAELRDAAERDRGDSPVPTAVIIVGLALVAIAVLAWASNLAFDFMNANPDPSNDLPDPNNIPGGDAGD
ncbi:hypothetical protein O7623_19435 [Solwaraspora sp. WMMD791]|uniref:hypothetical protein n=1 Tax=Solwaraspora sp. WMMD791 TaxID=3016086 RepID=UPI00249CAA77|nr:hypothetical protein [Solwaraspora sp. WMMD791]WFE25553.1 hypothetical protein O7623_19435 [Solwaraspora sp. WMMD791]